MIHEDVRALLGPELSAQVEAALDGRELCLAGAAEAALEAAAQAARALGGSGEAARLAEDLAAAGEAQARALERVRREGAVRAALAPLVHDPADILPGLDLEAVELDAGGGVAGGLEALLAPIRAAKPYLFKDAPALTGARPAPAGEGADAPYTMEELGKLSVEEYAAYRAAHSGFPKN